MKLFRTSLVLLLFASLLRADPSRPKQVLSSATRTLLDLIEPPSSSAPKTFSTHLRITKADNLPKDLLGATLDITLQAPDHAILAATLPNGQAYTLARNGQQLWIYRADKQFGVVGQPGLPRFASNPNSTDNAHLEPIELPLNKTLLSLSLKTLACAALPDETLEGAACHVISLSPPSLIADLVHLPPSKVELAIRDADHLLARLRYSDGHASLEVLFEHPAITEPIPAARWELNRPGETIEHTALSNLQKFLHIAPEILLTRSTLPTLGPATGQRSLVAECGQGRLELRDQTRVLFLKGTPEEMGTQQGTLLRREIRDCSARILYGVGVGSSFAKGRWFFGEIEAAQKRLAPFISQETYREMDAMADACGLTREEGRLANFFPELFHCSGFALVGGSVADGHVYHGRVLDYMRGIGLEKNAVVAVYQPAGKYAWVNITYAGFAGTVSAMNEKHISIGEMGGRGEGNWDGKPMAQLLREVMENAATLDQAVAIMKKGPRTCEYYYVIADGNTHRAVGIKATSTTFETVGPGDSHPQLSRPVKDTVLLSAGQRYETLVDRVQAGFGKFDTESARHLMDPPVCMTSNLHSVLFVPDTLDFYVANADSHHPASETRYTHYNLAELITSTPPEPAWKFWKW